MQPILAESVPHRGRAMVLAVVLAVTASLGAAAAMAPRAHHDRWHRQHRDHRLTHIGQCSYGYAVR